MINFYNLNKLLENSNNIIIKIDGFKKRAYQKIKEFLDDYKSKTQRLMSLEPNLNSIKEKLKNYPKINELIIAIEKQDKRLLRSASSDLHNYVRSLSFEDRSDVFDTYMHVGEIEDKITGREINEQEQYKYADEQIKKTYNNMSVVKNMIEQSLSRIDYNNSEVTIVPSLPESYEEFIPDSSAGEVVVGSNKNALFSFILENNKLIIDDIIEAGEDDEYFFSNNLEKQDYYNLISVLQNPNQIKKDVILTLYTARPVGDREFYSKTDYLPANVFLTNSFNHADGLASDLGGDERRDIYKVKINSKYLVKTLDGPVKYYMVVKDAPFENMNLY
jgi:hypothetical protein